MKPSDAPTTATEFVARTKPWRSSPRSPWPHKDAELIRLWMSGMSTAKIAVELGFEPKDRNKVIGRAHRLELPGRPSPIKGLYPAAGPRNGKRELEHAMKVTMPETRTVTGGHEIPMSQYTATRGPVRGPTLDATPRVYVPPRVSATATCQFPLWPNGSRPPKPPLFCGQPSVVGLSWCPQCLKRVSAGRSVAA